MEYEYGYVYGGLFVVGTAILFMRITSSIIWIKYCFSRGMEIFFAGFIQKLYPDDRTVYVYWSARLLQN